MIDRIARARAAKLLLEQDTFVAALETIKGAMVKDLLNATTPEEREEKWHAQKAVERMRAQLSSWAADAPK